MHVCDLLYLLFICSLSCFQANPHLQSRVGLFERRLRGGGGPREGPQRLPPPPQYRDVPDQAAGGESAHSAGGHHEGGGQLGGPQGQQHHLQRGILEPRASLRQHRGEAERKSRRCLNVMSGRALLSHCEGRPT